MATTTNNDEDDDDDCRFVKRITQDASTALISAVEAITNDNKR